MKNSLCLLFLCLPWMVYAAPNTQNISSKAAVCNACHGPKGLSIDPKIPHLAAQNTRYLKKQLLNLKEGKQRIAPSMSSLLESLNEEEMDALAAYYAKMPLPKGKTPKRYMLRGEQIYRGGDFSKHITACIACHGPHGMGNPQAGFPSLSGQHAQYILMQLNAFKNKTRTNDLHHIMQDISSRMSQDDMVAVAHYIEGLN